MAGFDFRAWRDRLGWSQRQAGAALGRSLRCIQNLENGISAGSKNLAALAYALERVAVATPEQIEALRSEPAFGKMLGFLRERLALADAAYRKPGRPRKEVALHA